MPRAVNQSDCKEGNNKKSRSCCFNAYFIAWYNLREVNYNVSTKISLCYEKEYYSSKTLKNENHLF